MNATESIRLESDCEEATAKIGRLIGGLLLPRTTVGLVGNLGAGKTRLVQAICEGLHVDLGDVNSPTFVLIQEYQGRLPVYHFDTYRLRDTDEFLELGADDYMAANGVCLIEWADRVIEVLPRDRLMITIEIVGETTRRITISAGGPSTQEQLNAIRRNLSQK